MNASGKWLSQIAVVAVLFFSFPPERGLAEPETGFAPPQYVLFLTADGFRSDYVEWYEPPNIRKLIAGGARVLHATNVFPTLTTANMASLVTGSYPRTTGIAANTQYVRELDRLVSAPRDNQAETIGETLRKAGWTTGAVNQFMLENRGAEFYQAVGYEESQATTEAILRMLRQGARFAAAIYGAPDKAGHRHGPRSEEVRNAVLEVDAAVGALLAGLKELGIFEQTLIAFSSDHGMSPFADKQASIEPARALREAGFRVATAQRELQADTQIVVIALGVRLVYFRDVTPAERERALDVLGAIEGAEVLGRAELDALGCHANRSGDVIISPLPGYVMSGAGRPGGLHGQMAERDPVLFFHGPGIRRGVTVESGQNVDVVPTVLHLLGIKPAPTVEGEVIQGVLKTES